MAEDRYIEGMEFAAGLLCGHCFRGVPVVSKDGGGFIHAQAERDGITRFYGCNAEPICQAIADLSHEHENTP